MSGPAAGRGVSCRCSAGTDTDPREAPFSGGLAKVRVRGCATLGRRWRLGLLIGNGVYSKVFRAVNTETGCVFAVKTIDLPNGNEVLARRVEELAEEVKHWQAFQHPHLLSVFGCEYSARHFHIHLEYVPNGSVKSFMLQFGPLAGSVLKQACHGSVAGLNYLHTREPPVVHGNLKGANVLVAAGAFRVKLTDFGCMPLTLGRPLHIFASSLPWMAPEVVQGRCGDGRKADIWSVGCLLVEMGTAASPWGDGTSLDALLLVLRSGRAAHTQCSPPIPAVLPAEAQHFAGSCLRPPAERPSASELLEHGLLVGAA